ncbi:MAG: hypothetical protein L3J74_04185 [Bacteroidales bacterium]|nr:hypothetical protein [Bacteroidales bacterium]
MKTKVLLILAVFSIIFFIDYLILTIIGCAANICGAQDCFYCNVFWKLAIIIVIASTLSPIAIVAYKTFKQNTSK